MTATLDTPNVMSVLDHTGDSRIEWNPNRPDEVDTARLMFDKLKDKKYLAYRLDSEGNKGEVIHAFDPKARRIVMSPQLVGG